MSYSPKFIYDAIKLTAEARLKGEKLPPTTIIPSVLITKDNAEALLLPRLAVLIRCARTSRTHHGPTLTLFTGQWADLPLAELAPLAKRMGYDGLELACWGDHFDVAARR